MSLSVAPTSGQRTDTSLPHYIAPYVGDVLKRAQKESLRPYQPYKNPRVAPQSGMTTQAYGQLQNMQSAGLPGLTQAMTNFGNIGNQAGGFTNYQSGYTASPLGYSNVGAGNVASQDVTAGEWNGEQADKYMSPYLQKVLDVQKNQAYLDFQRAQKDRNSQAVANDAFGGSRHGVVDALGQEALGRNMAEIEATGLNNAWNQAGQMFTSDRNAQLAAAQGNQQYGLQAALANQQSGLQAALANQQAGLQSGQFNEQARQQQEAMRQSGMGIGLQGLAAQQAASQGLVGAQTAQTDQGLNIANALATAGQQQQAYNQNKLDVRYQDFQNQQNYNKNKLNWYEGILKGTPVTPQTNVTNTAYANPASQMMGLGLGALGQYNNYQSGAGAYA